MKYFREAAPNHTADEEASLFPRLREKNREALDSLLQEADRLEAQHRDAEEIHERVETAFERWLAGASITPDAMESLRRDLQDLSELYHEHIGFEDEVLFPAAERLLNKDEILRIGQEMKTRRGL